MGRGSTLPVMPRSRESAVDADPGAILSFATGKPSAESPNPTGRWGALVVLARPRERKAVVVGVLCGVWNAPPTWEDVREQPLLRHASWPRNANSRVVFGWDAIDLRPEEIPQLTLLGSRELTEEETKETWWYLRTESTSGTTWAPLNYVCGDVEREWRWEHDREALLAEREREQAVRDAAGKAARQRFEQRLKGLTLQTLLTEDPFARWAESPPFPDAAFRKAATDAVHETCAQIIVLGPKPRRPAVRSALKDLVARLTVLDAEAGEVIETEEREDILVVMEEIAYASGQRVLVEEFGDWIEAW